MSQPNTQDLMSRIGATPGKLALIGVLAVILAYVIISQFSGSQPQPVALVEPARESASTPASTVEAPAGTASEAAQKSKPWPQPDLDSVVAYDPFSAPKWALATLSDAGLEDPAGGTALASGSEQALAKLRDLGATVIVDVDGERFAVVGEHQVRVGDLLEGFRVKEITESGIVLANEGKSP